MLSQDKVAEAARALAYHRYLQRDRMQRIETLSAELAELERVEREITQRQAVLDATKARQREQLAELERSEEHTSELQSLMRISYAVFCLKKKNKTQHSLIHTDKTA